MGHELRVSGIVEDSIVDGPGLRLVVFTQGCPHHCKGCHNPHTHDPSAGSLKRVDELIDIFDTNPLLAGITLSGGEPFLQSEQLVPLAAHVKNRGKSVWIYTGYLIEQLLDMAEKKPAILELLRLADTVIDGPYKEELRDLTLHFRGSSNQCVLDKAEILQLLNAHPLTKNTSPE